MSGLASLAGYDSDSDVELGSPSVSPVVAPAAATSKPPLSTSASSSCLGSLLPPPKSGLPSKLPPPSSSSSINTPSGSGLSLPPPSASASTSNNKRKVIKIDSIQPVNNDDDDQEDSPKPAETKKLKLGSSALSSRHSLFGMLPAPKRKDDEILAERKKEADARKAAKAVEESETPVWAEAPLRINEDVVPRISLEVDGDRAVSAEASSSKAKGKSNDAFRAMLGLKPAARPAASKPAAPVSSPAAASIPASKAASSALTEKQISAPQQPSQAPTGRSTNGGAAEAGSSKTDAAPTDFFSLGTNRTSANASTSSAKPSFSISAAPKIDHSDSQPSSTDVPEIESTDEYPGWQLDPDGSWVPITPEAQAQYHAYQQSLLSSQPSTSAPTYKAASNLDGTRDLLAAGLTPDDIRAFDASTAARDAYLASKGGEEGDSDKYAAAAEFAAGNREVQQRKPGMLKGLRKGQLSSLVSLASENRGRMEEKWQRGRDAQARRSNQYGW